MKENQFLFDRFSSLDTKLMGLQNYRNELQKGVKRLDVEIDEIVNEQNELRNKLDMTGKNTVIPKPKKVAVKKNKDESKYKCSCGNKFILQKISCNYFHLVCVGCNKKILTDITHQSLHDRNLSYEIKMRILELIKKEK